MTAPWGRLVASFVLKAEGWLEKKIKAGSHVQRPDVSAERGVCWRMQIMENKAMRKLAKVRSEEILLIEHRRAHNICIELAGVRMPFTAIKARLPSTPQTPGILSRVSEGSARLSPQVWPARRLGECFCCGGGIQGCRRCRSR